MSDLHVLVVVPERGQAFQLVYQNATTAKAAYRKLKWEGRGEDDFEVELTDDYGQHVYFNRDTLVSAILQDLAEVYRGQAEIALMQARGNATLQRKAGNDPTLKFLTPAGPAPGIIRS